MAPLGQSRGLMDLSNAVWRKASRSTAQNDNCVEVAAAPGVVAVRDSKNPHGSVLILSCHDFEQLTEALKNA